MNALYQKALKTGTALRTWPGRLSVNEAVALKVREDFGVPEDFGIRFIVRGDKTEAVLTPASASARMAWKNGHISRIMDLTGRGIDWATCYVKHAARYPRGLDRTTVIAIALAKKEADVPPKFRELWSRIDHEYWGRTYEHREMVQA